MILFFLCTYMRVLVLAMIKAENISIRQRILLFLFKYLHMSTSLGMIKTEDIMIHSLLDTSRGHHQEKSITRNHSRLKGIHVIIKLEHHFPGGYGPTDTPRLGQEEFGYGDALAAFVRQHQLQNVLLYFRIHHLLDGTKFI